MIKLIILFSLLISNVNALTFQIFQITNEPAFNYFASLQLWLLIIIAPMLLVMSLFKHLKKIL